MISTSTHHKTPETLDDRLIAHGGHGPGFDTLRLLLSFSVMTWHSVSFCYGLNFGLGLFSDFLRVPVALIVPCFFALSGFLVAGSMVRLNSLPLFLTFRALRIFPALCVEVALSALVLGPILTKYTLSDYVTDPLFSGYFANIIGDVRFKLPGVFTDNPFDVVNISLWTVPSEMSCYLVLAALILARLAGRRRLMLAGLVIAAFALSADAFWYARTSVNDLLSARMLVMCFLWGDVIYLWRDRVPLSGILAALALCLYTACAWLAIPLAPGFGSLAAAYLIIYLGHQRLPKLGFLARGDYSYGIYLYAAPIQQSLVYLLPDTRVFFLNVVLAAPIVLVFAAFSWHCIERPALGLRKRLAPSRALLAGSVLNQN
jgi:peptidoglycan/LPS O-acetylase OafA/YrhL